MALPPVLLLGCGKMGSALVRGWAKLGLTQIHIVDPGDPPSDLQHVITRHDRDLAAITDISPDTAVILAIKPQQMADVLSTLKPRIRTNNLIISIAAGRTTGGIENALHPGQSIVRAMPNLPAAIGLGITAAYATRSLTPTQKDEAGQLLRAAGDLVWLNDEQDLDAVTALSGSGPAYIFLLTEILARAGEDLGLEKNLAAQLARQTVIGSAALLAATPDLSATTLRENVTSPGGTTEAALAVLGTNDALQTLFTKALRAARDRAKELSA